MSDQAATNWSRGLGRAWIILSALWIAFIILLTQVQEYHWWQACAGTAAEIAACQEKRHLWLQFALGPPGILYVAYLAAIRSGRLVRMWILISIVWGAFAAVYAKSDGLTPEMWLRSCDKNYTPFYDVEDCKFTQRLFYGTLLAPPVALLLIGLATAWVIKGFRHLVPAPAAPEPEPEPDAEDEQHDDYR
jgi:hypothetical protein